MSQKIVIIILLGSFILIGVCVYILTARKDIIIHEAKIVTGIDKDLMPLKVTNTFPKGTSKVCLWISWVSAKINTQVLVKWYYITDDIPIYNYVLIIPKKQGVSNVMLSMPEGKVLPSGLYKVDILSGKKPLTKTLPFEIQ
jgi:hypothetical protein